MTRHFNRRRWRWPWWAAPAALLMAVSAAAPAAHADPGDPPAPGDLEVVGVHHSHVQLSWTWDGPGDPVGLGGFEIRWHEAGDPGNSGVTDATPWYATSGEVDGLTPDTAYIFEVVRVEASGDESEPSDPVTVTTSAMPVPTDLEVAGTTFSEVDLTWEREGLAFPGEAQRVLWHEAGSPGDATATEINPFTRWTSIGGLAPDTAYVFEVSFVLADGTESAPSAEVTATTAVHVPPDDLAVTAATGSTVDLSWTGASSESYRVRWHEVGDPGEAGATDVDGTGATVEGLSPSTAYAFEVLYLDRSGDEWGPSNEVTFTTPPHGPPVVQAERDGNDVTLTWPRPFPSGEAPTFRVYGDGVLETRVSPFGDPVQVTLPRQRSGTTIEYTVESDRWTGPTAPVAVTVPSMQDTSPPTEPIWLRAALGEVCDEEAFTITGESTDDVTAPGDIHYQGLRVDQQTGDLYVDDYTLPVEGFSDAPDRIVAVDEAGNRSVAVAPDPCDLT